MQDILNLAFGLLWESAPLWSVTLALIHLAGLLAFRRRFVWTAVVTATTVGWLCIGHNILTIIENAGVDSFSETRFIDFPEAVFWVSTAISIGRWPEPATLVLYVLVAVAYFSTWIGIKSLIKYSAPNSSNALNCAKFAEHIAIAAILVIVPVNQSMSAWRSFAKSSNLYTKVEGNFLNDISGESISRPDGGTSVLLYIGESTSSMNMGIYGYPRNTTPNLSRLMASDENLLLAQDVWSTHTHTSPSLLEALSVNWGRDEADTIKSIYNKRRVSIVDILNRAGVDTYLYGNQGQTGTWNFASSIVFRDADRVFGQDNWFLGNADYLQRKPYDHDLFSEFVENRLSKRDSSRNDLYVFHSSAGHGPYLDLIPENFWRPVDDFLEDSSSKAIVGSTIQDQRMSVEHYDMAVRYVDFSVSKALKYVRDESDPFIFVYFADHGESPYSNRGHDSSRFLSEMATVPFILYFNEAAKIRRPDLYQKYRELFTIEQASTLAQLTPTIFDLLGVRIDDTPTSQLSIPEPIGYKASSGEVILAREIGEKIGYIDITNLHGMHYGMYSHNVVDLSDDATRHYALTQDLSGRDIGICYRGSNSIAKALRANISTNCLEVDVTIQEDGISVFHPPDADVGLSLDKIAQILNSDRMLWLDIRGKISAESCSVLKNFISDNHQLEGRLTVQFPSSVIDLDLTVKPCIEELGRLSISRSYQIPTILGLECIDSLHSGEGVFSSESCQTLRMELDKVVKFGIFTDISFDFYLYQAVELIDLASEFRWNTWNIDYLDVHRLPLDKFRLIIPGNDDPNS